MVGRSCCVGGRRLAADRRERCFLWSKRDHLQLLFVGLKWIFEVIIALHLTPVCTYLKNIIKDADF